MQELWEAAESPVTDALPVITRKSGVNQSRITSRYDVESVSSIELNVNKSIECVAVGFTRRSVAKALKNHLDASAAGTSARKDAVYKALKNSAIQSRFKEKPR